MFIYRNDAEHPIGLNVRNLRKKRMMAVHDLAIDSGISFETITHIEDYSRSTVTVAELKALSVALGVTTDLLLRFDSMAVKTANESQLFNYARVSRPII